jgi:hypothetical protein
MKLIPRKGGHGYVTAYLALLGSAEARRVGFVTEDGERLELEKVVDEQARTITIRLKDGNRKAETK